MQLSALPPGLVAQRILALLPADARARAATVCRGWRGMLADVRLWTRLDLSDESGVMSRVDATVLLGAAGRAGGSLQMLDVRRAGVSFDHAAVLQVVQTNAGTLRELRVGAYSTTVLDDTLTPLLRAAPELRVLSADIYCHVDQAPALLRNEPPYAPLRLHSLHVTPPGHHNDNAGHVALLLALAAALPAHASLRSLSMVYTNLESSAACDALVDALLAARLRSLELSSCHTSCATVTALARLLRDGTLTELRLGAGEGLLDEAHSVADFAAALHANTTLTTLALTNLDLWKRVHHPGSVLLAALTGHPSLQTLILSHDYKVVGPAKAAVGDALGALVSANACALTELDLPACSLGDAALGPLCDALPRNTHLRILDVSANDFSAAFAAGRLLPAVRVNTSLRKLRDASERKQPAIVEAMQLLSLRTAADAALQEVALLERRLALLG